MTIGAPINWQNNADKWAPLHVAARNGNTKLVMLLVANKADLNIQDRFTNTPLIWAAQKNHVATVHALVEASADTTICGFNKWTAAEWANTWGHHTVAKYLDTVRFHSSAVDDSGQLYRAKGRSMRAIDRDLKEIANFDDSVKLRPGSKKCE